jgi:endonuclease/exonuclease/phosphatase family metal-dependent hydrolase
MYKNIFLLAIITCITSCSEKTRSSKVMDNNQEIRVLSYNIHHANPPSRPDYIDLEAIAKVIQESNAELVALQEVDVNTTRSGKGSDQAEELGKLTGMEVFFSKGIDYQGGEYGTAILSKYPILETRRYELPNLEGVNAEPRTLATATVDLHGEKIILANTHLDYTNSENNQNQVKRILEIFKEETIPVILAGDFNAVPESASIKLLDEQFTRSCTHGCPNTSPADNPVRIIDYIMASSDSNLEIIEHKVIDEGYASDHLPAYAVYRFEE